MIKKSVFAFALLLAFAVAGVAYASHAWGTYHWARTANPFTLKVGDAVTSAWDAYLDEAVSDWNPSSVLDLTKVSSTMNPKTCKGTTGRIEVCNSKYGNNGWLGIAQISISGSHITKGVAKMNDTYFNTATYNTPAWRRLVMCQEIAHDFGLGHQDEAFDNANLGSCMDYTNDPDGGAGGASSSDPSNEHPNAHDFAQLESIYAHLDSSTTVGQAVENGRGRAIAALAQANTGLGVEFGKAIGVDGMGRPNVFEDDLGNGEKRVTHVFWTLETVRAHEHE